MEGFGFQNEFAVLVDNAMAEIQPHALDKCRPDFNRQQVIVTRRRFVTQAGFNDGKNNVAFLPLQNRCAEGANEFAARGFEPVEIARVINVVANGTVGVADAVRMLEWSGHGRSVKARAGNSTLKNNPS